MLCTSGLTFAESSSTASPPAGPALVGLVTGRAAENSIPGQYDPKKLSTEEKAAITDAFLHKLVVAKTSMPMTADGVSFSWDKKTSKWALNANKEDLSKWGVGVRPGEKYSVTKVAFEGDRVELWLNDGGAISGPDKMTDSAIGSQGVSNQARHYAQMAAKKSAADGSRIKIVVKDLPRSQPLLEAIKAVAGQVIGFADSSPTADSKTPLQR